MASNRHLGRIIALQTLYEEEFRLDAQDADFDLQAVLNRNVERYKDMVDDVAFIESLVMGVSKHAKELDATLQPVAPEWPIDQIARMDRMVLRMGLYELQHVEDVPPKVVINEAVELAKAFGGDNSSKFINGVLGTLLRQQTEAAETSATPEAKKVPTKKTLADTQKASEAKTAKASASKTKTAAKPKAAAKKTTTKSVTKKKADA